MVPGITGKGLWHFSPEVSLRILQYLHVPRLGIN